MSKRKLTPDERAAPFVALALTVFALAVIGSEHFGEKDSETIDHFAFVAAQELVFKDAEEGLVIVERADNGETVAELEADQAGFTRTTLRALYYSRKMRGVGPEAPVLLGRSAEGRIILYDPSTEKTIGINAFGKENMKQFAALLENQTGAAL